MGKPPSEVIVLVAALQRRKPNSASPGSVVDATSVGLGLNAGDTPVAVLPRTLGAVFANAPTKN